MVLNGYWELLMGGLYIEEVAIAGFTAVWKGNVQNAPICTCTQTSKKDVYLNNCLCVFFCVL